MKTKSLFSNQRKPGEPSGADNFTPKEEEKRISTSSTGSASKETSPPNSGSILLSPSQDSAKKSGVSFRTDTQFNAQESGGPTTYSMGEWSAVGGTVGVLVDMSDTSSYSSNNSSALSATSMEATMRASPHDTPFAQEIDNLVAKKDWDGLQLAARSYEPSAAVAVDHRESGASIDEKKRRKRELEAAFSRKASPQKVEEPQIEEPDTHWA